MGDILEDTWEFLMDWWFVFAYLIFWGGLIYVFIASVGITSYDSECVEDIAESVCEEYGQVFKRVSGVQFSCYVGNERQNDYERYNFLDEERERCVEDSR